MHEHLIVSTSQVFQARTERRRMSFEQFLDLPTHSPVTSTELGKKSSALVGIVQLECLQKQLLNGIRSITHNCLALEYLARV